MLTSRNLLFFQSEITFLGFIESEQGIKVDEENIKAIKDWGTPKCMSGVGSVYGLSSFYKHFVSNFSTLVASLNDIGKKNLAFKWE